MRFEKELEITQAAQKLKKAKASASKGGKHFAGLEDTDFSNTVSKTTWRGRGQLGGAVASTVKKQTVQVQLMGRVAQARSRLDRYRSSEAGRS
jgi:hypothetical protein